MKDVLKNFDGTVDIYFGPKAPIRNLSMYQYYDTICTFAV